MKPREDASAPFVHPTSVVEEGAKVGKFSKIWYFAHVAPGAVIGENCSLGQNTYVERNAIVGHACRLGNSVSIFSHVELEDFVFCAPYIGVHPYFVSARRRQPACRVQEDAGEDRNDAWRKLDGRSRHHLRRRHVPRRRRDPYQVLEGLVDDDRNACPAGRLGERVRGEDRSADVRASGVASIPTTSTC